MWSARFSAALLALLIAISADARIHRSSAAKNAFKRSHLCPATHRPSGPCPGYVVDHRVPLCAGGPDVPSNMQWQDKPSSLKKDRLEWRLCRLIRQSQNN